MQNTVQILIHPEAPLTSKIIWYLDSKITTFGDDFDWSRRERESKEILERYFDWSSSW